MDKVVKVDKPKREDLIKLYDVCNRIFKNKRCFYTREQVAELKKDNTKEFI